MAERSGDDLRALFEAKVRAELEAADALMPGAETVAWAGSPWASLAAVKGSPGAADLAHGTALAGADGEALRKALSALGRDPEDVFLVCSRPSGDEAPGAGARRLRLQIEAVDPEAVVALDASAADDLVAAFCIDPLRPGRPERVLGRTLLFVDGLERSLAEPGRKRRVWQQLKALGTRD